jgi:hypothetical protein
MFCNHYDCYDVNVIVSIVFSRAIFFRVQPNICTKYDNNLRSCVYCDNCK